MICQMTLSVLLNIHAYVVGVQLDKTSPRMFARGTLRDGGLTLIVTLLGASPNVKIPLILQVFTSDTFFDLGTQQKHHGPTGG